MIVINAVALAAVFIATFGFHSVFFIAVGSLISSLVSLGSFMFFSNRLIGYSLKEQFEDICPALIFSVVMGITVYAIGFIQFTLVLQKFLS